MSNNLNTITIRPPTRYAGSPSAWAGPTPAWLGRTWTVTHSTSKTYVGQKNCRVTYSPSTSSDGRVAITLNTTSEKGTSLQRRSTTSLSADKAAAVTTAISNATLSDFKPKSKLGSGTKWEILGWGDIASDESGEIVESWLVVYYHKTDSVDIMSSRKQGMGSETAERCRDALRRLPSSAAKIRNSVVMNLKVVDVSLPWNE